MRNGPSSVNHSSLSKQAGFTLIELLVTTTLIAVAAVAIVQVYTATTRINRQAKNLAAATQSAQKKIEALRNGTYNGLATGTTTFTSELPTELGTPTSATYTVTEEVANELKRVDLAISYTESGHTKNVQISTKVAARGLDR